MAHSGWCGAVGRAAVLPDLEAADVRLCWVGLHRAAVLAEGSGGGVTAAASGPRECGPREHGHDHRTSVGRDAHMCSPFPLPSPLPTHLTTPETTVGFYVKRTPTLTPTPTPTPTPAPPDHPPDHVRGRPLRPHDPPRLPDVRRAHVQGGVGEGVMGGLGGGRHRAVERHAHWLAARPPRNAGVVDRDGRARMLGTAFCVQAHAPAHLATHPGHPPMRRARVQGALLPLTRGLATCHA